MKLIIINGPAGVGKTTVAKKLHTEIPFSFLLDLDEQRNFISEWREHRREASILSFDIALSIAEACFKRDADFIIGKSILDINEGGRSKNVIDMFIDIGKKYKAEIYEIMLWADKQTVIERANTRGYKIKDHLTPERVGNEWENIKAFKEKRKNAIVVDTDNLSVEGVLEKVKAIVIYGRRSI